MGKEIAGPMVAARERAGAELSGRADGWVGAEGAGVESWAESGGGLGGAMVAVLLGDGGGGLGR